MLGNRIRNRAVHLDLYYLRARSCTNPRITPLSTVTSIQVSPRVAGQVLRVYVTDNQHVNKGDVLAEIDPSDYETRLAEAKGKLADIAARVTSSQTAVQLTSTVTGAVLVQASAGYDATRDQAEVSEGTLAQDEASIHAAEAMLQQSEARVKAAEAETKRAAADAERYRELYAKDEVSKQMSRSRGKPMRAARRRISKRQRQSVIAATNAQLCRRGAHEHRHWRCSGRSENQIRQAGGRIREAQSGPEQVRVRKAELQAHARSTRTAGSRRTASGTEPILHAHSSRRTPATLRANRSRPGNFVQVGQMLMALV